MTGSVDATATVRFPVHTPETATGRASTLLGDIVDRHGDAGTMVRTMAGSPAMLEGYLHLSRAAKRAKLDRKLSERISIAIQARLGCATCLQSHIAAATAAGVTRDDIADATAGTATDVAAAALIDFAVRVHEAPSTVTADRIDALRRHGYSDREILDVVALVALNHLTGSFNLVAGIVPTDPGPAGPAQRSNP